MDLTSANTSTIISIQTFIKISHMLSVNLWRNITNQLKPNLKKLYNNWKISQEIPNLMKIKRSNNIFIQGLQRFWLLRRWGHWEPKESQRRAAITSRNDSRETSSFKEKITSKHKIKEKMIYYYHVYLFKNTTWINQHVFTSLIRLTFLTDDLLGYLIPSIDLFCNIFYNMEMGIKFS